MAMKLKAKKSAQFDADVAPSGKQLAVCVGFVDLGTHETNFKGKVEDTRKVFLVWELVDHPTRPLIGKDFTASLHEKALLRQWLKKWRNGKDLAEDEEFDITKLVGQKCEVTVEHVTSGDRTYAKVIDVAAVHPRMLKDFPAPEHALYSWCRDDGKPFAGPVWDMPYLYGRPIEDWVKTCQEESGRAGAGDSRQDDFAGEVTDPPADDIPF